MKQIGYVVEINNGVAKIEVDKQSACDMCENAAHCVEKCKKVYATALNPINAKVGDIVEIETETGRVLFNAFLVFVIPVFLGIAAYLLASLAFEEKISVLVTFVVLVLSLFAFSFGLNKKAKNHVISKIVKVL